MSDMFCGRCKTRHNICPIAGVPIGLEKLASFLEEKEAANIDSPAYLQALKDVRKCMAL